MQAKVCSGSGKSGNAIEMSGIWLEILRTDSMYHSSEDEGETVFDDHARAVMRDPT